MEDIKGREKQIVDERLRKISDLRKKGIEPYGYQFEKNNNILECTELKVGSKVKTAGRVMNKRDLGKISFAVLRDQFEGIQLVFQKDLTPDNFFEMSKKYLDSGDFAGVEGKIIITKTGQKSILVNSFEILSKAIKPLPEKWHGLQDEEERYRKRYLDLAINNDVKEIFIKRDKMMSAIREFMSKNGFVEIETPLLQSVYGGAAAKPFVTHCNAFNSDVYLSIAPELYLKKALVGGFDRVYEITKKFRNEGVDRSHNPEHMTIEWYQGYADYNDGMEMVKRFILYIVKSVCGKTTFDYQGTKIDVSKWQTYTLEEAIKKYLGEDISKIKTDGDAKKIAEKHKIEIEGITKSTIADELMKLFREKLIQPTFLIDYPAELAPLAKPKRGDPTKAEIFQPFIGGLEIARAYSELNDPILQEKHFKEQEQEREKGNQEAMPTDSDFINALQYGMPPACGVGFGIERLLMLLTDKTSIRDVLSFPFMKPEQTKNSKNNKK
jgi:lysyl-tRNA synthetase, class II